MGRIWWWFVFWFTTQTLQRQYISKVWGGCNIELMCSTFWHITYNRQFHPRHAVLPLVFWMVQFIFPTRPLVCGWYGAQRLIFMLNLAHTLLLICYIFNKNVISEIYKWQHFTLNTYYYHSTNKALHKKLLIRKAALPHPQTESRGPSKFFLEPRTGGQTWLFVVTSSARFNFSGYVYTYWLPLVVVANLPIRSIQISSNGWVT